jgi:hypothetical protein
MLIASVRTGASRARRSRLRATGRRTTHVLLLIAALGVLKLALGSIEKALSLIVSTSTSTTATTTTSTTAKTTSPAAESRIWAGCASTKIGVFLTPTRTAIDEVQSIAIVVIQFAVVPGSVAIQNRFGTLKVQVTGTWHLHGGVVKTRINELRLGVVAIPHGHDGAGRRRVVKLASARERMRQMQG